MSKGFKILLIVFVIFCIVNAIVYVSLGKVPSNKQKQETQEVIKETPLTSKIPEGITLEDEQITIDNYNLNYDVSVLNSGKNDIYIKKITVIALDDSNNIVSEFEIKLNKTLKPKRKIHVSTVGTVAQENPITKMIYRFES